MTLTKSAQVTVGTSPTWEVSATGFVTQSGTVSDIQADTTLPIYLLGEMKGIKKVCVNTNISWYLTDDGNLYGCGYNYYGQQGSGGTSDVTTFTKRAENVKDFSASYDTTWYITNDGDLYGCGSGAYGQQGSGGTSDVTTFTKRGENVREVFAGQRSTWYITTSGDLYGCGYNGCGEQGSGNTSNVTTFTKRAENVSEFFWGFSNGNKGVSWYITTSGDLYGCGCGGSGQQGSGGTSDVTTFTKRGENVKYFFVCKAGPNVTFFINNNGDLYGCGNNHYGQQGSGNTSNLTTFTKIAENVKSVNEKYFGAECYSTWYLTNNGDLYGCGYNAQGQQGNGTSGTNVTTFTKRASNVKNYCLNENTMWYVTNDGDLYGCGANWSGQQGSGGTSDVTTFTKRAENVKEIFASASISWYITNDGDLYGCGTGGYGQQGSGGTSDVTTFTKRAENVKEVYLPPRSYEIETWYQKNNGDLYGCGYNYYGQQGSGGTSDVTTFTRHFEGSINTASLTITPTPNDATVTINSATTSSADIRKGMPAEWSVSKTGYVTQTGTVDHIYDDTTLTVDLESE